MRAIVQMFNQSFVRVQKALPQLQRLGFSHVLISPPQKSNPSRAWWARYQPVDFRVIEGPLGNERQLQELCWLAGERGLAVVADTVLNHMTNDPRYVRMQRGTVVASSLPHFSPWDFRPPDGDPGRFRGGRGRPLPDLRMDSPWVRQQLRAYVHGLFGLGVRGYRFDAAKHIPPDLFEFLLHGLPPVLSFGEMVYGSPQHFPERYWRSMKAYDFPLAHTLKVSFAPGGDLRWLIDPERHGAALWGPHSVPFVNHHDLIKNRRGFDTFRIADSRDKQLAYTYLLARGHGLPLVYGGDLRLPSVKAGMQFLQSVEWQPAHWVEAGPNHLVWTRGRHALAAVNKSGQPFGRERLATPLRAGVYRDLLSGQQFWVDSGGQVHNFWVGARSARLLLG